MKIVLIFILFILNTSLTLLGQPKIDSHSPIDSIFGRWVPLFSHCQGENRSVSISKEWVKFNNNASVTRYSYSLIDSIHGDGSLIFNLYGGMNSDDYGKDFFDSGLYKYSFKIAVYFHDEALVLLPFKDDELAPGEFSQPEAFIKRNGENPIVIGNEVKAVFVLPEGFRGYTWIAMEQSDGVAPELNSKRSVVINIPETGILESQVYFMPVALAKREFDFYFSHEWGKGFQSIQQIDDKCLSFLQKNNYSEQEILSFGYYPDKIYVYYFRYNNPGRKEIKKFFEKDINGQVFWFRVDTLKNLLKTEPMLPRLQRM